MSQKLIEEYTNFVDKVTSDASKSSDKMNERIEYLGSNGVKVSRLLTAGIGLSGEIGEFNEIIKKIMFQEKTFDAASHEHMKRELGDVLWYWVQGCKALGFTPDEVMDENIRKLEKRYPNGFEVIRSEVREQGDI